MTNDFIYCRTQSDFIDSIFDTVKQHDGYLLSELLNVIRMYQIDDLDFNDYIEPNLDQQLINDQDFLWKLLSQHHWSVCYYLHLNDIDRAFRHQSKKFSCLMSIFNGYLNRLSNTTFSDDIHDTDHQINSSLNDDEPSWLLPVFNRIAHELRLLALPGNDELNNDDNDTTDNMNTNSTIQTYNSQLISALGSIQRFPLTNKLRKVGIFIIVNQMLKAYYALHKFNLCTYFISKSK
ncbi:unnamed protein product [Rotaria sp. Silwood1]|nr:unnamed protein product [Rotaria sp. Silwood1]CAF4999407.1 unnamed protein product [Rotaria sp. Silwood1]